MSLDDMNKLNRLEELKEKLYEKNFRTKIEHRDVFSRLPKKEVLDSWGSKEENSSEPKKGATGRTSFFKKFFIFSVIFFVLSLGYAAYVFFIGGNTVSNNNIDISIAGNNFTAGGEKLPLVVGITNRNNSALELVDLVMQYPEDGSSSNPETNRISVGTIPAGGVVNENLSPVLYGQQGSDTTIKISIEYSITGSNAVFTKEKDYDVTINSTPINLSADAPATVSPNQNITLNVKTTLNATNPVSNILLKIDYPVGFQFASATPAPSFGNNVWSLGDLAPGAENDISVSGKMIGVFDGDQKTFNISSGSQSGTDKTLIGLVFNSVQQVVTITKPFIEANFSIDNIPPQSVYTTDAQTPINAQIEYTNNLDTAVNDLQIVAKISGNAINPSTIIVPQGFYDSSNNTITWDQNSQNGLGLVNPGDSGYVKFSFSPLSLFSASLGILSNPSINIEVDISGKQSTGGFAINSITNSSTTNILITSDLGLSSKALYYSGPFTNTGPIPPKVGQTTTYTVVWTLSNTANSISNAQVTSTIPQWVDFVGPFSPASADLSYNSSTRQITWNAGSVLKGAGITGVAPSVAFQISLDPSLSQVGTIPTIINNTTLTGHDDFANVDLNVNKLGLTTKLDSDSAFPTNGGIVSN